VLRPASESNPHEAGFTLTELLVSLALLVLVSLLLLRGLGASGALWRGAARVSAAAENIQGAQELLRHRLEHTYLETALDAIPPYPFFDGGDTTLIFYAPPPDNNGTGALRRYTLAVTAGGVLTLSSRDSLFGNRSADQVPPPLVEALLRGVQSLDISYFDSTPGPSYGWQQSWRRRSHPPALVRLQVNFPPNDHRWWPQLLVHPIATTDRDCVLSRSTRRCAGRS